jgi:hypothetical protein
MRSLLTETLRRRRVEPYFLASAFAFILAVILALALLRFLPFAGVESAKRASRWNPLSSRTLQQLKLGG